MKLFTSTAPRATQLEGKRDVARISANGCVITSWSSGVFFFFFYELLSQSRPTHQAYFARSRNDAFTDVGCLKNRNFRAKVSELWSKVLRYFKPSVSDFLDDTKWLLKLAYFANIYQHVSTLNTCMYPQIKQSTFHTRTYCIILLTNLRNNNPRWHRPIVFYQTSVYFYFPNTTAGPSGRAV